eukprot:TRINITY_DN1479_c1_g1_i12.p3 TRINITY_DN1479_c1_g1~~TRINITY_DN1479_c1_g1_i12.p3  ORF type:complete len:206 (-),score=48.50 TRINITY_DN1479_c1_g1_i12:877-1494(-)
MTATEEVVEEALQTREVAELVLSHLGLADALRSRRVCRAWHDAFRVHLVQFDTFWKTSGATDDRFPGWRMAELIYGRPGTLIQIFLSKQKREWLQFRGASVQRFTVAEFCRRERASLSKLMRGLCVVLPLAGDFEVASIEFFGGWGWHYLLSLRPCMAGKQLQEECLYEIDITEAHLDYDSYMCEDWYEKHHYRDQMFEPPDDQR